MPNFPHGITNPSVDVFFCDDTGAALTGKVAADFPTIYYSLGGTSAKVSIGTLSNLASETAAYTAGGLCERNYGVYRLDLPTTPFATSGNNVAVFGDASGKHVLCPNFTVGVITSGTGPDQVGVASGNVGIQLSASQYAWGSRTRVLIGTGTANQAVGGIFYQQGFEFNNLPYFAFTSFLMWWDSANNRWTISTGTGVTTSCYFCANPFVTGATWTGQGTYTGTPTTVNVIGEPPSINFSQLAVNSTGGVTVGTNADKTGYSLTTAEHTNIAADVQTGLTAQGYTTTRAGYLDYLLTIYGKLPANAIADQTLLAASIAAVLTAVNNMNNLSALANLRGPSVMEVPATGTTKFQFSLTINNESGVPVDLDTTPTITATDVTGANLNANVHNLTHDATGAWSFEYWQPNTANEGTIRIVATGAESTSPRRAEFMSVGVNINTAAAISTLVSQVGTIFAKLPANAIGDQTTLAALIAALGSPMQAGTVVNTNANATELAIRAKTDNLPADPASQSATNAALPTVADIVAGVWSALNTDLTGEGSIGASLVEFFGNYLSAITAAIQNADSTVIVDGLTSNGTLALQNAFKNRTINIVDPLFKTSNGKPVFGVVAGDDYYANDSRALTFPAFTGITTDWTDATAAVEFGDMTVPATIQTRDGSSRVIFFELTTEQSAALYVGGSDCSKVVFDLVLTLGNEHRATLINGGLIEVASSI